MVAASPDLLTFREFYEKGHHICGRILFSHPDGLYIGVRGAAVQIKKGKLEKSILWDRRSFVNYKELAWARGGLIYKTQCMTEYRFSQWIAQGSGWKGLEVDRTTFTLISRTNTIRCFSTHMKKKTVYGTRTLILGSIYSTKW